jgi:nicotinamidase/pyrazinamidase
MKAVFFLDVDTQRDFMLPSGALYVPGADRMIPKLQRLFDLARKNGISIISSVDAHSPDDSEFQQFPQHCLKGAEGQKKLDETSLRRPLVLENRPQDRNLMEAVRKHQQIIIEKQELDVFSNPVMEKLLRILPHYAIVFGVATEYCVKLATLGLRKLNIKTAVLGDVIRPIDPERARDAIDEMRQAGAEFITLDTLIGVYRG